MDEYISKPKSYFKEWARNLGPFYIPEIELSKESKLFRKMIEEFGFTKNYIEIYNYWADVILEEHLKQRKIILPIGYVYCDSVKISKPKYTFYNKTVNLTPKLARDGGYTYSGEVNAVAHFIPDDPTEHNELHVDVNLGKIPIMLGSKYCHLHNLNLREIITIGECPADPLGYFIIKGGEKNIVIQEKLRNSQFISLMNSKGKLEGRYTCYYDGITKQVVLNVGKNWTTLKVSLWHIKQSHIPLFILFKFIGYDIDDSIKMILSFVQDEHKNEVFISLQPSVEAALSHEDYLSYWAIKRGITDMEPSEIVDTILNDINKDLFPNIPIKKVSDEEFKKLKSIKKKKEILYLWVIHN